MAFEKLDRIVEITVTYTAKSALAIMAGKQTAFETVESPVLRVGGKPIIPGSSLKGGLRSTLESILSQKGVTVCVPFAAIPKEQRGRENDYVRGLGRKMPCGSSDACPVCQIFGTASERSGSVSGRAIVLDAKPEGEIAILQRSHVAITRDTKAASGGKLMSVEAVDAGAAFVGIIRLVNPEDWQVGAVLRALEGLALLGMGSKKTAGYGELEIQVRGVQVRRMVAEGWQSTPAQLETYTQAFAQKFGY